MTSAAITADAVARLAAIVPPQRVLTHDGALAAYESDGLTAFRTRPLAVVVPETASVAGSSVQVPLPATLV